MGGEGSSSRGWLFLEAIRILKLSFAEGGFNDLGLFLNRKVVVEHILKLVMVLGFRHWSFTNRAL